MSILDNPTDLEEAQARLATTGTEQLVQDLAYWSIAELDYHVELAAAQTRVAEIYVLHKESQRWGGLIATELRARRDLERAARADG